MKNKKVLVAMSGGVDSSVAAALLSKKYATDGVFMKNWDESKDCFNVCNWKNDRRDAMKVAAKLGINFRTVDFGNEYEKKVMKNFFEDYGRGKTPNPDVWCNKFIKFGALLDYAKKEGFDYLATGHYAGIKKDKNGFHLIKPRDAKKDQTYFLHQLTQKQLSAISFPLQKFTKKEVREIAKKMELATAQKKESMGICFVGRVPMQKFLQQRIKYKKGDIINIETGEKIGTHHGTQFYTIGQRHGFSAGGRKTRLYVVKKNRKKNILYVGQKNHPLLLKDKILIKNPNWILKEPKLNWKGFAKIRHGSVLHKVRISGKINNSRTVELEFKPKIWAPSPGQFCVLYSKNECMGGGEII